MYKREDYIRRIKKYSYFVDHKHKLLFYNVKKCGTMTLYHLISNVEHEKQYLNLMDILSFNDEYINDYPRVGIIRNPYKRFISGYMHVKIMLCKGDSYRKIKCSKEEELEKYIEKLLSIPQDKINPHFAPLTELIDYEDDKSIIFDLENKDEINKFLNENGYEQNFDTIIKNQCKNIRHRDNVIEELKEKPHLIEKLYNYYKKDFEVFNYDKKFPF